jgi:hypothetical protein
VILFALPLYKIYADDQYTDKKERTSGKNNKERTRLREKETGNKKEYDAAECESIEYF